jgi:alanine-glyoxylate transaminase / serine-glyoxylate transaminase / serine-pyruvate transaminase
MNPRDDERIPGTRLLHSPGPSPLPTEVLQAMQRQPMDLGDPRVDETIADCDARLKRLVNAPPGAEVYWYICNGHGIWEAVAVNLLDVGQAALLPGTGHFSEQWARLLEGLGRVAQRTPWREREVFDGASVEAALQADRERRIRAVFAVHTDTASAIRHDLGAARRALDASGHPALLVADAVASLGTEALDMQAMGLDVIISASQKGLMSPPGIGVMVCAPRAVEAIHANPAPRMYWDARTRGKGHSYDRFFGTPPLTGLYALQAALRLIERETLPAVLARHARVAKVVRAAVAGWAQGGAVALYARHEADAANAVTAITVPAGVSVDDLRRTARERFAVQIAGGLGPLFGRAFRIGHLGDQSVAQMLGAIAGVEAALRARGVPVGEGASAAVAAAAALG